jgi:hypothetical protein
VIAAVMGQFGVFGGLLLIKAAGCALAYLLTVWKPRILGKINFVFALVVGWNLYQLARAVG